MEDLHPVSQAAGSVLSSDSPLSLSISAVIPVGEESPPSKAPQCRSQAPKVGEPEFDLT